MREPLDGIAEQVRHRYPLVWSHGSLVPLGNGGGFSGARLWRGEGVVGRLCLRAWPAHKTLVWVHRLHELMESARRQGLAYVPAVYAAGDGNTAVEAAGRVWELTQWLDGRADFAERPSWTRLQAACEALARLHRSWEVVATPADCCPAVRQRRKLLAEGQSLIAIGWQPSAASNPQLALLESVTQRAWRGLPAWLQHVSRLLGPWSAFRCTVQPCLRDVWHDHLLFEGDRLTGLIDYGAVQTDHVAVDLARMLGSLVGDDPEGWGRGLSAYRRIRALNDNEEQFALALDRIGTILGVVNWLRWLYQEGRTYEDLPAVGRRLENLLDRIERWTVWT